MTPDGLPQIRVEGILVANPALARLWRVETGLLGADVSVELEGDRISRRGWYFASPVKPRWKRKVGRLRWP